MSRRFFRRLSGRYRQKQGPQPWYLRPFSEALAHPVYFSINRRAIVRGTALGLFVSLLPMPGHTPLVLLLGLVLRANLPVAGLLIWVANPLTYGPILYFEYQLGRLLLPGPELALEMDWDVLVANLGEIWQPLWAGGLIAATTAALCGYALSDLAWRLATRLRYRRRLARRRPARTP